MLQRQKRRLRISAPVSLVAGLLLLTLSMTESGWLRGADLVVGLVCVVGAAIAWFRLRSAGPR